MITAPLPIGFALLALAMSGGRVALAHRWYVAWATGVVLSAGEWFFSLTTSVELAGALASLVSLTLLALWGYMFTKRTLIAMPEKVSSENSTQGNKSIASQSDITSLWRVLIPYLLLTITLLLTRLLVPLRVWLQTHAVLNIPAIALHLQLLYIPGFWVLLAACTAVFVLTIHRSEIQQTVVRTYRQFLPGAIAILCFLATSQVMNASDMTSVLGRAAATLGSNYGWIAPWLGALGGWLTGSNAGGNAMFALLQKEVSRRVGLPLYWVMGAQNGAGSIATMASPSRIILAATAAGLVGRESVILRKIGPAVLIAVVVIMLLLVAVIKLL